MVCAQCGATNDEGQRFCYNCGVRLESQATGTPQYGAVPPPPVAVTQPQGQYLPPAPDALQPAGYSKGAEYGGYGPQVVPNSRLAIISLVAAILSFVMLPVIAALPAVITGHMARREIRESGGRVTGDGLALLGLIIGYANLALAVLVACAGLAFFVLVVAAV
jgi:hypothetical protein